LRLCHNKIIFEIHFQKMAWNIIISFFLKRELYAALDPHISGPTQALLHTRCTYKSIYGGKQLREIVSSKVVVNLASDSTAVAKENSAAARDLRSRTLSFLIRGMSTTYHANRNEIFRERTWVRAIPRLGLLN